MIDLRKIAIIFVIAVLYVVLVNSTINAFYPEPRYDDYCLARYYPEKTIPAIDRIECQGLSEEEKAKVDACFDQKGNPEYITNSQGCAVKLKECNMCQKNFDDASQKYNFVVFMISALLALFAIAVGLTLPSHKNELNEWIATGFMLGGLITLFVGTFRYYQYLGRYIKPLVILAELIIVIYLSYKKLGSRPKKKR